jgi:hypothetical protein
MKKPNGAVCGEVGGAVKGAVIGAVHGSLGVAATSDVNDQVHAPVYRAVGRPLDVVMPYEVRVEMWNLK